MLEKLQCAETERALLGKLLLDPDTISKLDWLKAEHFYQKKHQIIYAAIEAINLDGKTPDVLTVVNYLKQSGDLQAVGGAYYITGLVEGVPSAATIVQDESRLIEYWKRRTLYVDLTGLLDRIEQSDTANLESEIVSILERVESDRSGGFEKLERVADQFLIDYDAERSGKMQIIKTGLLDLDRLFGGFKGGDLMYLAGATSAGKTAFAIGVTNRLIRAGVAVGYVSLEMSAVQLFRRLILESESTDVVGVTPEIAGLPLFIDDSGDGNIGRILTKANLLVKRHSIRLLVIDHLQLVSCRNGETRNQELTAISGALKRFAVKNRIAVLGLSQLNRKAGDDLPKLEHLRDSGALEQDADYVLFIYRPHRIEGDFKKNTAFLELAKNRHGKTGQFKLTFLEGIFRNHTNNNFTRGA